MNVNTNLGAMPLSVDILEKANIGLWAFEIDEGCEPRMYVDDTMLGLIGLKEQTTPEKTYHAWYDNVDADHYGEVAASVEKMTAGIHAEVQYPWHHPDGRTLIVRCGGVRNPAYTKGVRIEGTHMDVTEVAHFERESAEKEYRGQIESGLQLLSGLANEYYAIYRINLDDNSYEIFNLSEEAHDMKSVVEQHTDFTKALTYFADNFIHELDRDTVKYYADSGNVRNALKDRKSDRILVRRHFPDGWKWITMNFIKCEDDSEQARHVIFGFVNCDDQVRLDREKQRTLEFQDRIVKRLCADYERVEAVEITDISDTDRAQLLALSSKRTIDIPGVDAETAFTRQLDLLIRNVVHPDDRDAVYAATRRDNIMKHFAEKPIYDIPFRTLQNGERHWYMMRFSALDPDNVTSGMVVGLRNIDAEKQTEQALAEALTQAESANRAKTTFLNNMSHDIRTPMNAIIGFTGLAASHLDDSETVRNYLAKIRQSSEHLLALINDVLDMSRIESGKMTLNENEENLSDIMHNIKDIIQADVKAKSQDLFIDSIDVKNENVICDKLRLNQILLNVISNAIKYTPQYGNISVTVTQTSATSNFGTYEFRVKDNGMGMSQEFLGTVFEPFTRVRSSTVSGIQGTGLGMAIVKNIVEMMGGTIKITSAEDAGTDVVITLQFRICSDDSAEFSLEELRDVRALCVDDDTSNCLSMFSMLRDVGLRPEWCTSGNEAIIRAKAALQESDAFKIYIIDWLMPGMDGLETVRRIRKLVGDGAAIIVISSYDWTDVGDEVERSGVTAVIPKPMFASDLHRALAKCIGQVPERVSAEAGYNFEGRKILLVEDNEMNREIATEILTEAGISVDHAPDGTVAVEKMSKASEGDYDLILMDVQMPVMDGYEATRRIRKLPGSFAAKIPIIAMTANAFAEDRRLAFEAGMDEHLTKPIDVIKLKDMIHKFLSREEK